MSRFYADCEVKPPVNAFTFSQRNMKNGQIVRAFVMAISLRQKIQEWAK